MPGYGTDGRSTPTGFHPVMVAPALRPPAVAARAARVPGEALAALPARDFVRIKREVQGFLLGAGSADPEVIVS